MSTSKLQKRMSQLLSTHVGQYTIRENHRPIWLVRPDGDGSRLELDFYIEELMTGIEVQGNQHYTYCPFFHKSYEGFLAQCQRDRTKRKLCIRMGVKLMEVSNEDDAFDVIEYLSDQTFQRPEHPNAIAALERRGPHRTKRKSKRQRRIEKWVVVVEKELAEPCPRKSTIHKYKNKIAKNLIGKGTEWTDENFAIIGLKLLSRGFSDDRIRAIIKDC